MTAVRRVRYRVVVAALWGVGACAAASGATAGPSAPGSAAQSQHFAGWVASATGRFAHDKGHLGITMTTRSGFGTRPMTLRLRPRACPATGRCVRLSGTVTGTITVPRPVPDQGEDDRLRATGTIKPLGAVTIRGDWQIPGLIRNAHEHLQLTLLTSRGRLVISAS